VSLQKSHVRAQRNPRPLPIEKIAAVSSSLGLNELKIGDALTDFLILASLVAVLIPHKDHWAFGSGGVTGIKI
jgi:hypothetical protein